jgi:1-acyl-sn-glycerol-3-phosphate acyltransferase
MLRSFAFNLLFYVWTAILAIVGLPVLLAGRRHVARFARFWEQGVGVLIRHVAGISWEIRGHEHVPALLPIYAVKHQSAFETVVMHLVLDDPAIVLKGELTRIPLFGWFLTGAGMIRIDRSSRARAIRSMVEGSRAALARRQPVVIFPEGTRTPVDAEAPYHPGVAALYLQLKRPVVPVALNSGLFWGRRSFRKRPGRIVIEFLPPIEPGLDRRGFMSELRARLEPASQALVAEGRQQLPDPGSDLAA